MWGRGRKAKASPILVRFKSLLRWSKGKLRNRKLERIAQGPTAAKGQSWLESLAVPTQHPINAGKMDLMGFMSQKLKETWQMIGSKASSISQMWKSSPTEGQGPAKRPVRPWQGRLGLRAPALGPASFLHPGIPSGEAVVSPTQRSGPHIPDPSRHAPSSHETLGSEIPAPTGGLPDQPSSPSLSSPRETGHHTSPFLGLRCGPGTERRLPPPPRPPAV